jgi:DNA-binding response OmpR family regulator
MRVAEHAVSGLVGGYVSDWGHTLDGPEIAPIRIALLVESEWMRELVTRIVEQQGWQTVPIGARELESPAVASWDLIVIGSAGDAQSLTSIGAKASRNPELPVLIISVDREPQHIADALRSGADDYLVVPFDPEECVARMRALIKRVRATTDRRRNQLVFDFAARTISAGPTHLALSAREWSVLITLLEAEGDPVSIDELSRRIWGDGTHYPTLAAIISRIRRKLDEQRFRAIEVRTFKGRGYAAKFRRASDTLPHHDQRQRIASLR